MSKHLLQWAPYLATAEQSWIGLGVIVAVLLVIFLSNVTKKSPNYPPGPPRDPILGNARQMIGDHIELRLTKWGKRYGTFYSLLFGTRALAWQMINCLALTPWQAT